MLISSMLSIPMSEANMVPSVSHESRWAFRNPRPDLAVHRVEQAVRREFRVKDEADEAAFQPIIDSIGKGRGHVRIHMRLIVGVDQVQKPSRVVREAAAI